MSAVCDVSRACEALQYIPPDIPREEWARVAFACQEAGITFLEFDRWSQGADNYRLPDCRATWNSCQNANGSGITAGTLFYMAKQHGWRDDNGNHAPIVAKPAQAPQKATSAPPAPTPSNAAADVWARCEAATAAHAYIVRTHAEGAPLDGLRVLPEGDTLTIAGHPMAGALVVPAYADGALQSLQFIPPEGDKMNLPGCRMAGASFTVGTVTDGKPVYIVEGIGQAWACFQATGCAAVVAFGCGNMATIARTLRGELVLVPDAGQEHKATDTAATLRCKVAMMPEGSPANFDAADLLQRDGVDALRALLDGAQSFAPPPHPLTVCIPLDFTPHPPRWILPGLIAEGVTIIAGMRGVGKTTALLPLALAAAGLHEQGYPLAPSRWRHVCYVTEDTGQALRILSGLCDELRLPQEDVRERFHLVAASRLPPGELVQGGDPLRERFSRDVDGVTLPPLVVLDTQAATVALDNENDNAEASRAIAALKQGFSGLPVWLVAHVAKSAAPTRGNLTARGAGAFEADANAVLYAIQEDETRYLLTGKTRFEPRWRELRLDSYTKDTRAINAFGEPEQVTLRWAIARPLEAGERAEAKERAAEEAQRNAEATLRQAIRDAVQVAQQEGNPLSRSGIAAKVKRKRPDVFACIERLLSERWLFEAETPRHARANNNRAHVLFNLSTAQHDQLRNGGTLTVADLPAPKSWQQEPEA